MAIISRREAITGVLGTTIVASVIPSVANEQSTGAPAFSGEHRPKPLPFDPAKLDGISEKLIRSHWANNYTGSVNALNFVERRLLTLRKEKDLPAYVYGQLKREELMRTGSVVLHELYFANLGGDGKVAGKALAVIDKWFGGYDQWQDEFRKTASSLSGGSGWVVLAYNVHTASFHNYWASDHMISSAFSIPILVLDMYEHSYQLDYGADAVKYIDAFIRNVNWERVNDRVENLPK